MAIETISRHRSYLRAILVLLVITISFAQSATSESAPSSCASKLTCHECIQTKSCAWCLQPDYGDKPRCFQPTHDKSINNCDEEYRWDPDNEQRLVIFEELTRGGIAQGGGQSMAGGSYEASSNKGSHYSSGSTYESYNRQHQTIASHSHKESGMHTSYGSHSESGRIVQIYPQRVNLKLRISMCFSF